MITPELIGNQAVYDRLNTLLSEDRLPHAILIEGPYGSGRTTLARQIACAAACLDADAPCGRCAACLSGDSNPDITTVTTDNKNQPAYWYDLQGRQYTNRPTQPGVYIHSGKKIVIK